MARGIPEIGGATQWRRHRSGPQGDQSASLPERGQRRDPHAGDHAQGRAAYSEQRAARGCGGKTLRRQSTEGMEPQGMARRRAAHGGDLPRLPREARARNRNRLRKLTAARCLPLSPPPRSPRPPCARTRPFALRRGRQENSRRCMMPATFGFFPAARTAAFNVPTIASGVLAGAKNMPQEPIGAKFGSTLDISGTSGKAENGLVPVKASARTRPSLIRPMTEGGVTNITLTLPPSMAVITSEAPL